MINEKYAESALTAKIIGCAMEVHRTLENGFQEKIYQRCMAIEMAKQGLHYSNEHEMLILYKGKKVGLRRVYFFVEKKIMLELKAVIQLEDVHLAQSIIWKFMDWTWDCSSILVTPVYNSNVSINRSDGL